MNKEKHKNLLYQISKLDLLCHHDKRINIGNVWESSETRQK